MSGAAILEARQVSRIYRAFSLLGPAKVKCALDDVSLAIAPGETVALLGRSGCGKSTLARVLTGLEPPDSGEVCFRGRSLSGFRSKDWMAMRGAVQMVFQDAIGAVDPRSTIGDVIAEPLRNLAGLGKHETRARVGNLLAQVCLDPADASKSVQQMSGGQLQRVCIARALAPGPELLILDEAVSSLDLTLQLQMLEMFSHMRRERGLSFLLITHDLRLAERFCSRVLVMKQGRVIESVSITAGLALRCDEGRALQEAILPAMPTRARPREPGSRVGV